MPHSQLQIESIDYWFVFPLKGTSERWPLHSERHHRHQGSSLPAPHRPPDAGETVDQEQRGQQRAAGLFLFLSIAPSLMLSCLQDSLLDIYRAYLQKNWSLSSVLGSYWQSVFLYKLTFSVAPIMHYFLQLCLVVRPMLLALHGANLEPSNSCCNPIARADDVQPVLPTTMAEQNSCLFRMKREGLLRKSDKILIK